LKQALTAEGNNVEWCGDGRQEPGDGAVLGYAYEQRRVFLVHYHPSLDLCPQPFTGQRPLRYYAAPAWLEAFRSCGPWMAGWHGDPSMGL